MKISTFAFLGLVSLSLAAPSQLSPRETDVQATDRLLFSTPIDAFLAASAARNPPTLDWENNECTASPEDPFGFNFGDSCIRHDFGYRNYKDQGRFTETNKAAIDNKFKQDMYNQCENEGGVFVVAACKGVANIYYEAVKAFGTKRAVEIEGMVTTDVEFE